MILRPTARQISRPSRRFTRAPVNSSSQAAKQTTRRPAAAALLGSSPREETAFPSRAARVFDPRGLKRDVSPRPLPVVSPGFTLVELMVTIVLVALLVALGVPTMRDMIRNNQQASEINALLLSLQLARASAVKHGTNAVVCISDLATPPTCNAGASQWETGWIVFVDGNPYGNPDNALAANMDPNANGVWDPGEDWLLHVQGPLTQGTTLRGNNNVRRRVTFNAQGEPTALGGTLVLCAREQRLQDARAIVIANTGRPHVAVDNNGNEIVEISGGADLATCTP